MLLTRCLDDTDDEVRDRAALNLRLIEKEDMAEQFISNGEILIPSLFFFPHTQV